MSEPVGPQYGLEPLQQVDPPPRVYNSQDSLTNPLQYNDPSATEFGGVAGLTQPPPHVPTAYERLRQIHMIDPDDPGTGDGVNSVPAPELEGDF